MFYSIINNPSTDETLALADEINRLLTEAGHCSWQHFNHPQVLIILSLEPKDIGWLKHVVGQAEFGYHQILYYTKWLNTEAKEIIHKQKKDRSPGAMAFHNTRKLLRIFSDLS